HDVLAIDRFLREQDAQQKDIEYKPLYFLAPRGSDADIVAKHVDEFKITKKELRDATFASITKNAFAHFKDAKDGDICLLYYSGHGSQADAPEVFWHTKPDRQNETMVCVDSRDPNSETARDIIDKELAYLIWDAINGKDVHCVLIMDCCHSGNIFRSAANFDMGKKHEDSGIRYRYVPAGRNMIPFEDYLGYKEGFYKLEGGNASISVAKYIHMAACRDSEKAQETNTGGLFSTKLIESLRAGGTAKSYRELVQGLTVSVNNLAAQQNPVAFAAQNADLDQKFLGTGLKPFQPTYEVRYDNKYKQWRMYAGTIHNIIPSSANGKTIVQIGADTRTEVKEVKGNYSVLDDAKLSALD
ncbi:MAG TPA: caspase family protein, partial [Ferruginibacter sp.]|nr:caspase family protein [Ferruginibacter sp.]